MSAERATADLAAESLYVVRVQDRVDGRIAGHDGWAYVSPPASRDTALALVGLLLGADPRPVNGGEAWTRAVPAAGARSRSHGRPTPPREIDRVWAVRWWTRCDERASP